MTSLQNLSADDLEQSPKHVHKLVQEVTKLLADYLADGERCGDRIGRADSDGGGAAHAIDNEKPLAQLHDNERVIHYETPEEVSARLDLVRCSLFDSFVFLLLLFFFLSRQIWKMCEAWLTRCRCSRCPSTAI